jgi:hypothetical protein
MRKVGIMEEEKRGKDGRREFGILESWKGGMLGGLRDWSGQRKILPNFSSL